ncbi:MAG: hypothetical protein NWF01_08585 [Candidatus Bathyarchaeota archaeon]|nr:hypothetical protein [Candidatus Bathyarchaeota archaeon]
MAFDAESKIKQDLLEEIGKLEESYSILGRFIGGADFEITEITWNLQAFKDCLSRASAYVLALYNLKGRRVTIPWEQLFTSLDYALATVSVAAPDKQKAAIKTILDMSKDQIFQVLSYFETLKDSLK